MMQTPKFPNRAMLIATFVLSFLISAGIYYFIDTRMPDFSSVGGPPIILLVVFYTLNGISEIISGKLNTGKIHYSDFFK